MIGGSFELFLQVINDLLDPTGQNLRIREDSQVTGGLSSRKLDQILMWGLRILFIKASSAS